MTDSSADLAIDAAALAEICRKYGVVRLDLFGSSARGEFEPASSDVDLLVELPALPPGDYADAYFGLLSELEAMFARRVDLLTYAAPANPHLRRRVEAERRSLFKAA